MTYDEAIKRAETIIAQLESSEAISMEEYRRLAKEAIGYLQFCKQQIEQML